MTIESIGLSALAAFQRALSVTAHNIANANTPGYSRQSVVLTNLTGNNSPVGPLGGGVSLAAVRRSFDALLFNQLHQAASNFGQTESRAELASLVDGFLSGEGYDLAAPINQLGAAFQDLANDPTSIAARTAVLSDAQSMADRFRVLDTRLSEVRTDMRGRVEAYAREINSLTGQIADLNRRINDQELPGSGPNDLLDLRNQAILELSQYVDIQVIEDGNSTNIALNNGAALVTGVTSNEIRISAGEFDRRDIQLELVLPAGAQDLDERIAGGRLAGAFAFIDDVLNTTQNEIGRLALAFGSALNEQHIRGLDLNGNLGQPLFALAPPDVLPAGTNSNLLTDTTAATIEDVSQITGDDYVLEFDGAAWSLTNERTGANVPLTPDGPDFLADGLRISVDPGAAAGDRYLIRPTRPSADSLEVLISDPNQLAAAAALNASGDPTNQGSGAITAATILDPANAGLLTDVEIVFTSGTTYSVNGGPDQPFTPGGDIDINGWRVQINGAPLTGDTFRIENNIGGVGDGANALTMASLERLSVLDGGTLSVLDGYRQLVSGVGVQTNSLNATAIVQSNLLNDAERRMANVSGVNLDEEAVKLQEYQQAYVAAAEVFSVANDMFDTLIRSVGR
ncbi:MAG: flagellar hook-associated protein FlgK [Pseudomonadota bacterium]